MFFTLTVAEAFDIISFNRYREVGFENTLPFTELQIMVSKGLRSGYWCDQANIYISVYLLIRKQGIKVLFRSLRQ
jgi:hypothetical protein